MLITTMNHSETEVIWTNLAIEWGPHSVGTKYVVSLCKSMFSFWFFQGCFMANTFRTLRHLRCGFAQATPSWAKGARTVFDVGCLAGQAR